MILRKTQREKRRKVNFQILQVLPQEVFSMQFCFSSFNNMVCQMGATPWWSGTYRVGARVFKQVTVRE